MTTRPGEKEASALASRLASHGARLLAASVQLGVKPEDPRDVPVRQVLARCSELGRGCADLGRTNNSVSLGILARAILENLILILWVTIKEQNATDLENSAIAELARVARINLERGKAQIVNRVTGADATAELLGDDLFKKIPKRKSVEARADEADVLDLYNIFYRYLSLETHGHAIGEKNGPTDWDLSVMHMQGIGAMLQATECAGSIWLMNRARIDNEQLRKLLGLD